MKPLRQKLPGIHYNACLMQLMIHFGVQFISYPHSNVPHCADTAAFSSCSWLLLHKLLFCVCNSKRACHRLAALAALAEEQRRAEVAARKRRRAQIEAEENRRRLAAAEAQAAQEAAVAVRSLL
jgi:hypothetical protein